MFINQESLVGVFTAYKMDFEAGLKQASPEFRQFTMETKSTSASNQYGWLAATRGVREWVGERVYNNLSQKEYTVPNRKWEESIEVERDKIEDDQYHELSLAFRMMGDNAAEHPGDLVLSTLDQGKVLEGFDGVPFFSTTHPMGDATYSNYIAGGSAPWYLLDASKPIKPMGLQMRRDYNFKSFTNLRDSNVFEHDKFKFGADARYATFFGLPQLALRSEQPLTESTLDVAKTQMQRFKNEVGKPLRVRPTILLVSPENEIEAEKLINSTTVNNGDSNVFRNSLTLIVSPYLSSTP